MKETKAWNGGGEQINPKEKETGRNSKLVQNKIVKSIHTQTHTKSQLIIKNKIFQLNNKVVRLDLQNN